MSTLQSLNTWLSFNIFSTHHEVSIGFLKYISTGLTLQYITKKRVLSALMNVDLTKEHSIAFQKTIGDDMIHNHNNKHKPDGQLKDATEIHQRIAFPSSDLSTKRIEFVNGSNRVITVAYAIKCHPAHSTLLTSLLIKLSVLDQLHHLTPTFISFLTV